jgi:serine/threonine-protein kinase HipA
LLAYLGGDLPGAVVVEAAPGEMPETSDEPPSAIYLNGDSPLKFSLAGVQLKFSALRKGKSVVLPVSGRGGDWILKLPDSRHALVPANEFSMLTWAQESGIEVPDVELIPIADVEGLPREIGLLEEQQALLVRRYDRQDRRRIHQEDFAQVLKLYPSQKYIKHNFETIGRVVRAVAGDNAFLEYARRLAFMVLSGNGDAHHKNWSLIYPDDRTAALSPAYDLVFTRAYYPDDRLALNLDGNKDFRRVDREAFRRLARKCDFDEQRLAGEIGEMAARIRAAWARLEADLPMHREAKEHLRHHLSGLQL